MRPGGYTHSHAETRRENRYCWTISPQAITVVPFWTEMEKDPTWSGLICTGASTLMLAFPAALAVNVASTALVPEPHDELPE